MSSEYFLEMKNIEKEYSGNKVLKNVSLRVKPGEILALIGENGAGKSTIMNILFGMPVIWETGGFDGEVLIDGKKETVHSPKEAMELGIGMVHQELLLVDNFNITENIKLNREVTKKNIISALFGKNLETLDNQKMHEDARNTLDSLGLDLNENTITGTLAIGYKQFIEIARELDKGNIKLIVLDEPTAVLTESEAEHFLACVKKIAQKGIAIIFISHRLDEIAKNAHRVSILRDGELVGDYDIKDLDPIKMSELMVGRRVEILNKELSDVDHDEYILELNDFSVNMPSEKSKGVNLKIRKGEIIGIAGLAGHGKSGISPGIMGLYPSQGQVMYKGNPLNVKDTYNTLASGIAFMSEDRRGAGLMLEDSIERNIVVEVMRINNSFLKKKLFFNFYDSKSALEQLVKYKNDLDIRCLGFDQPVKRLSGGNQQKVCLARALMMDSDVLLISEPTRGIDIGAKDMILNILLKLNKEKNTTIVVTSSELAELRSVCSRIVIMAEGSVSGILQPDDEDYKFGLLMSGVRDPNLTR